MTAKENYYNWRMYQEWLRENELEDDSDTITTEALKDYVDNQIPSEDRERIMEFVLEAY